MAGLTQQQVNEFADATGDHQWLHVDVEKAKQGPYHGTIAHGFLTVSLLPVLLEETASITGVIGITLTSRTVPPDVFDNDAAVSMAGSARSVSARSIGTRMD